MKKLAQMFVVVALIENDGFCHGGLSSINAPNISSIVELNEKLYNYMTGKDVSVHDSLLVLLQGSKVNNYMDSVIEYRELGRHPASQKYCKDAKKVQRCRLDCTQIRQFIGHTYTEYVQTNCNGMIFCLDTYASRAFGIRQYEGDRIYITEIDNTKKINNRGAVTSYFKMYDPDKYNYIVIKIGYKNGYPEFLLIFN